MASRRLAPEALAAWRAWNPEQRVAAVASLLLVVSTFGPFSFVEAALILVAGGVLWLLISRAQRKRFHLPFGDGTVILVAGVWSGILIVVRLFDRPLGQNLLALACAAILAVAGLLERAKRPPDDVPEEPDDDWEQPPRRADRTAPRRTERPAPPPPSSGPATPAARGSRQASLPGLPDRPAEVPEPDTPPEFEPTRRLAQEDPDEEAEEEPDD